ncbi:MAG TPA: hypothetical protein PLR60_05380 [Syntrophorhabdaceae bacterium]|nr:hypothetical protein [Syntrophorhabdaceae bacterium]
MLDRRLMKEVINILMESASYFRLTVSERLRLVKHLMNVMM